MTRPTERPSTTGSAASTGIVVGRPGRSAKHCSRARGRTSRRLRSSLHGSTHLRTARSSWRPPGATSASVPSVLPRRLACSAALKRSSSPPTSACAKEEVEPVTDRRRCGYAASGWIGVLSGSISEANPRSQLTTTSPRSSILSTTPRSPAHRPESSAGVATSSILAPTPTPARIRAASSLAPLASMTGISVSRARSFTLPSPHLAGDPASSAKSRLAGELLRNRRLRTGSPASGSPKRAR